MFYLWQGYRYSALSDFLPAAAMASVIWMILTMASITVLWLMFRGLETLFLRAGLRIRMEHLLLYACFFVFSGTLSVKVKQLIWHDLQTGIQAKLIVAGIAACLSVLPALLLRDKAKKWLDAVMSRISLPVWFFTLWLVIAFSVTIHQTWKEFQVYGRDGQRVKRGPVASFVFDDGYDTVYTRAKPIFDRYGEVACVAVIPDYINKDGFMTEGNIRALQNGGWEIMSHTATHADLTTLDGEYMEQEIKESKERLVETGFRVNNFVYPHYKHNASARNIARKYYRSARSGAEWITGFNVNPHSLRMYALSAADVEHMEQVYALKEYIDRAEQMNSWILFTLHNVNPEKGVMLAELIEYLQDKGIRIATVDQALDVMGDRESRLGDLLFIFNHETPLSGNLLRKLHIVTQHLLDMFQRNIILAGSR